MNILNGEEKRHLHDRRKEEVNMKENNGHASKQRRNHRIFGAISVTIFVLGIISFLDAGKQGTKLRQKRRKNRLEQGKEEEGRGRQGLPLHLRDDENDTLESMTKNKEGSSTYDRYNHRFGGDDDTANHGGVDDRNPHRHSRRDGGGAEENLNNNRVTREEKMVLTGNAVLIDVKIGWGSLDEGSKEYTNVKGIFCRIDWNLHKNDPPTYPMYRDLMKASNCDSPRNQIQLPLRDVAEKARKMDRLIASGGGTEKVKDVRTLPLQGVVFHESRCGSTLVANAMAASDPLAHRVYSESPPPITVFKACDSSGEKSCDIKLHNMLIQDTMFMMGRTNRPEEKHLFLKIQSIGSTMISSFRRAMPEIPWIFVYRDPVQVMMSHLDMPKKNYPRSNCLRSYHRPSQLYKSVIRKFAPDIERMKDLSYEQHCAAHLATITESIKNEQLDHPESVHMGIMVNYIDLPELLITHVFPRHFRVTMTSEMAENIHRVSGTYSKQRDSNPKVKKAGVIDSETGEFKGDTERKEKLATPEMRDAANQFLQSSFSWMESERETYKDTYKTTIDQRNLGR